MAWLWFAKVTGNVLLWLLKAGVQEGIAKVEQY
jgi:hypothetical protein